MEMFSEHDDDRKNLIQSLAVMMMMKMTRILFLLPVPYPEFLKKIQGSG